jgi:HlyD family secretion protein
MPIKNLERLMRVTSIRSWIALLAVVGLLVGVVFWSIFGTLPERIEGHGVLQTEAGTQQITAGAEGILVDLTLKPGDQVTNGQVIGQLRAARLTEASHTAQARYDEESRRHAELERSEQNTIASLQTELRRKQGLVKQREESLARHRDNLAKRIVTQSTVDAAKLELDSAINEVSVTEMRIRARQQTISMSSASVADARILLQRTLGTAKAVSQVRSAVAGKVTAILRKTGDLVYSGQAIADVASSAAGSTLEVVAFILAKNGKRVLPGQTVRLAVAGVRPQEFGYLQGEVKQVSDYPVSPALAQGVLKEGVVTEASYEVKIRPIETSTSPTRYAWLGGRGSDENVRAGTKVNVSVQVSMRRPITLVLPLNREDRVPVAERSASAQRPPG